MIYRYRTKTAKGPEGSKRKLPGKLGATVIAEIGTWRYVHVPDDVELPELGDIELFEVRLDDDTRRKLKKVSPVIRSINEQVVARIREHFTVEDELMFLRLGRDHPDIGDYHAIIDEAVAWGKAEKMKIGF